MSLLAELVLHEPAPRTDYTRTAIFRILVLGESINVQICHVSKLKSVLLALDAQVCF